MSNGLPANDSVARLAAALGSTYAIEREIGRGGMAVVYLAHDQRHDRKVAIKVLRPDISAMLGAERFLNEIRVTANLQHPHILPLHDSGTVDGAVFYVMPYVEGESVRARLEREKQLPVAEAVRIAREVASALDYAHRRGVIHRDIKPENVLLHEGTALVADFGIALAARGAGPPTRMTESGMSLGTPQYMSPEQAMGERDLTPRSDVYALGAVLYEMLIGEPPFTGPTAQAVVARIVTEEPRSLIARRRTIPPNVEAAVLAALSKLPADRFASASEFASALADGSFTSGPQATTLLRPVTPFRTWLRDRRSVLLAGTAVLAILAVFAAKGGRTTGGDAPVTRFALVVPESLGVFVYNPGEHGPPVVSHDGSMLAFSATRGDTTELLIRRADEFQVTPVAGVARRPFFSPDGQWLGFLRGNAVWKVPPRGGEPVLVTELRDLSWNIRGHVWHAAGAIFVAASRGVWRVPDTGGQATLVYPLDSTEREVVQHVSVSASGHVVLSVHYPTRTAVAVLDAGGKLLGRFPQEVEAPAWAVGDLLLFTQGGQPTAARAEFARQRLIGRPVRVANLPQGVSLAPATSLAWVDPTSRRLLEPVWVSRTGVATPTGIPPGTYRWPRLSPDGQRLAMRLDDARLYVLDLRTGVRVRLASEPNASEPVWLSDGSRIVFNRGNIPNVGLLEQSSDAGSPPDTLFVGRSESFPTSISPGDSLVLFYSTGVEDPADLYVLHRATRAVRRLSMAGAQRGGRFSPDGRWIAFQADDAGQMDIYVRPWPGLDSRYAVSTGGGEEPVWSHDGRELYFRNGERIMMVRVAPGPTFRASAPVQLFGGPYPRDSWGDQSYDVASDGRFLMLRVAAGSPLQLFVVQNWITELRRQVSQAN